MVAQRLRYFLAKVEAFESSSDRSVEAIGETSGLLSAPEDLLRQLLDALRLELRVQQRNVKPSPGDHRRGLGRSATEHPALSRFRGAPLVPRRAQMFLVAPAGFVPEGNGHDLLFRVAA